MWCCAQYSRILSGVHRGVFGLLTVQLYVIFLSLTAPCDILNLLHRWKKWLSEQMIKVLRFFVNFFFHIHPRDLCATSNLFSSLAPIFWGVPLGSILGLVFLSIYFFVLCHTCRWFPSSALFTGIHTSLSLSSFILSPTSPQWNFFLKGAQYCRYQISLHCLSVH